MINTFFLVPLSPIVNLSTWFYACSHLPKTCFPGLWLSGFSDMVGYHTCSVTFNHLTPNPQAACPSFHLQMAKCLTTPCSHIVLNSLSLLFIPISQPCSLTQLFFLFLALLGSRYLRVDLHTISTFSSCRLKAAHPAYYHYHTA